MRVRVKSVVLASVVSILSAMSLSAATADMGLVEAVKQGNHEAVRSMIKNRADVNAAQPDGATPLAWAVHKDDLEIPNGQYKYH